jgi:hypothetical protein
MDRALEALYDSDRSGLGSAHPNVNRWLGDIRKYFPTSTVRILQRDAIERLDLTRLLFEPEVLEQVEADVHLVATMMELKGVIPERTKDTARRVVAKVVRDLEKKLKSKLEEAIRGAINRAARNNRPRVADIDWDRTIRANLHNYLPEQKVIIPERLRGHGHKARRADMKDVILCVDQSGSMAQSVVYSSIFAAVMASLRSVRTSLVVFDTEVVDLTELLADPVDVLFGTQLGGGTDIHKAVRYCSGLVRRPEDTVLVLITDLYEGGNKQKLLKRVGRLIESGVTVVCLLALSDEGAPWYDHSMVLDYLKIALTQVASISERRIFRLTYGQLTGNLPSFLLESSGVNNGFMLAQYTAASLVSECKGLSHPASVDSIPTGQHHEDHVSMGPAAARTLNMVLAAVEHVLAIEVLVAAQGLEFRRAEATLCDPVEESLGRVRAVVPRWTEDRVLHRDLEAVSALVRAGQLV